jgi:hypothetical protein
MDKPTKDAIRELVLNLRKTLEAEIERELGRYGIYANRAWIAADELPRLTEKERDEDRPRLEAAIRREQDAGLDQAEAVRAFIRETAYTHMNRLLGLKCMEVRGLITETITTRPIYSDRSQRHRDYLDEHPEAHRAPDRGLMAMLQEAYAEASQQIGMVFDPDSDYSIAWPRPADLKECIDRINDLDKEVARRRGEDPQATPSVYADDTILGWVYQYFQEEEKKRVFYEVSKKKKKISGDNIIPATTAYTERYMVQFLVENSLGALWMEMYPDSDLCERWAYFVEDPNLRKEDGTRQRGREPCPVAELTLLDPAGGSGHFLLYAFDLFAQMYEAEAQMQGQPVERAEIARRILRHNLYGIDIDLRSVQLSALNLYMKACTYAGVRLAELQDGGSVQMNLVCADIVLRRGPQLKELLDRFKEDPLTQDLIKTLWGGLENARELGSLLKVEEQVDAVIARKREGEKGTFWEHPDEAWDLWKQDFLNTLKDYVDRAAESFDLNRRMFGQEAIKGVQLLDLLTRRYDVVATNPPYLYNRNMGGTLRSFVRQVYSNSGSDLYACFVTRCTTLTRTCGFVAMISQQSFMFIRTYENLRKHLLSSTCIRCMAHLGPGAFEDIGGEVVNTTMYTLRVNAPHNWKASFIRLFEDQSKDSAIREILRVPRGDSVDKAFELDQSRFMAIDGSPVAYWVPSQVFHLFETQSRLDEFASPVTGIQTGNNAMFVRNWWEPEKESLGSRWKTYVKGGPYNQYYGNLYWVIDWEDDGNRVQSYEGSTIRNREFHFREGLTYSDVASTGFNARLLPEGSLFDLTGHSVFSDQYSPRYLLALLNSKLVNYLLNILNPTFHFQVGNVASLPFVIPSEKEEGELERLASYCIDSKQSLQSVSLVERDFKTSGIELAVEFLEVEGKHDPGGLYLVLQNWREAHETRLILCSNLTDELVFDLYGLSPETKLAVLRDQGVLASQYPALSVTELGSDLSSLLENLDHLYSLPRIDVENWAATYHARHPNAPDLPPNKLLVSELTRLYVDEGRSLEEICSALKLNPVSVVALRRELGLVNPADLKHEVENLLTHRIWELCKRDEDGIIPYDDGLRNPSLLAQVRGEIEAIFGTERAVEIEAEMDEILGRGGLAGWLENPFFKKHRSQFKRRPILWQITSPDQEFRVLVYYHQLDHDTLPKIRSQYLWPLLERARTQLRAVQEQNPFDLKAIGDLEAYIADLEECDRRLESVIQGAVEVDLPEWANGPYRNGQAPYHPDLDDGVKVNILPLQAAGLLPMKKVV